MNFLQELLLGTGALLPAPVFSPEGEGSGDGASDDGEPGNQDKPDTEGDGGDKPGSDGSGEGGDQGSPAPDSVEHAFAALEKDKREWLQKGEMTTVEAVATKAFNLEKLLGKAIIPPGKDASDEDIDAYHTRLGRPAQASDYAFTVPKDMPEKMPYDGEEAKAFGAVAHSIGLTQAQAEKLHDYAVSQRVELFNGADERRQDDLKLRATAEQDALVKVWGPMDGEKARTNLELADRALQIAGGPEVVEAFTRAGLIEPQGEGKPPLIMDHQLAVFFAKVGQTLYTEGEQVRGDPALLDNPFSDEKSNLTLQMQMIKADPNRAHVLIAAAGKTPADFGIAA